jgi:hypothetical protein
MICCALAAPAAMDYAGLASVEKLCNKRIETLFDDPNVLLGFTRGVYLEGYGAVFSAEVNLAGQLPGLSPFRMEVSPEEIAKIRQKKLDRLPPLRKAMEEMLLGAASTLGQLPPGERVVIAINLPHRSYENVSGIPRQVVLQADRKSLLEKRVSAIQAKAY